MRRLALLTAIAVLRFTSSAGATDFYVAPGGSDGADGSSVATAWATLNHAAGLVNAGDSVHVLDGSYQGFDLRRSGMAGQPITFVAASPNVQITADNGTTPDGINVENAAYIVIDGFTVDHRTRAGIRVAVSQFVTVRNCHTGYNGHWGIFSGFADDFTIENNETHHSVAEHGIYVSNSGDRPIIRGNVSHDNYANGIHMNGDHSEGGDGLISNALVERNIIYGNGSGGGSGINMDGVTDSVVQNNLLYDNHGSGISLYRIDGATGSTGNIVVNNTIVNAADARWCVNINSGSTGNHILNNILYNAHPFHGAITIDASSVAGFVSDHNSVVDRFSTDSGDSVIDFASWKALGYDATSFLAAPADLFVTPDVDFHLRAASPAIDAGTSTEAPAQDLDGTPRPIGVGVDVGAYESPAPTCGNGQIDPGEQCAEPGLSACSDPCTTCEQCRCAVTAPVCGDGVVCGSESCEDDSECAAGQTCQSCQCVNPLVCTSGIAIDAAKMMLRAAPFSLRLKGEAVIPKPWTAVDPAVNGVRFVVDAASGTGKVDLIIPGGPLWSVRHAGTVWSYRDPSGSAGGVTRLLVKDRSNVQDGLVRWTLKASGGGAALPDVSAVRTAAVLGGASECAALQWNPPGGARPRCQGDTSSLSCR